jgi:hypothetical protein
MKNSTCIAAEEKTNELSSSGLIFTEATFDGKQVKPASRNKSIRCAWFIASTGETNTLKNLCDNPVMLASVLYVHTSTGSQKTFQYWLRSHHTRTVISPFKGAQQAIITGEEEAKQEGSLEAAANIVVRSIAPDPDYPQTLDYYARNTSNKWVYISILTMEIRWGPRLADSFKFVLEPGQEIYFWGGNSPMIWTLQAAAFDPA